MEIKRNRVMEVNDLISQFNNMDFDGDSLITLAIHSEQAKEDLKYMFIRNLIEFDQADRLLIDFEHESIFSAYMFTHKAFNNIDENQSEIDEWLLEDIMDPELDFVGEVLKNIHLLNYGGLKVKIDNKNNDVLTVSEILINIALGIFEESDVPFYTFEKYGVLNKKNLTRMTYDFSKYLDERKIKYDFWDRAHEFNKFLLEISTTVDYCVANFSLGDFVVKDDSITEFKKNLIQNEPYLAFHQNMILFEDYVKPKVEEDDDNILNNLFNSGARLKSVQLLKAASNTGIPTDIYGKAFDINIKHSLLEGLTQKEYFQSGDSARLALQQRQDSIPKGGELQRKFFFVIGIIKQDKEVDCCFKKTGKSKYFEIEIKNKTYLQALNHRWFLNEETGEEELIDPSKTHLIGTRIKLRTPITCQLPNYRVCKKCLGEKRPLTANLGAPVGQYLAESIIQLTLRAHHFGGVFMANIDDNIMKILRNSEIYSESKKTTIVFKDIEELEYIKAYLIDKYSELIEGSETIDDKLELIQDDLKLEIIPKDLPYSEDAVKILKSITSLIDKNRSDNKLIPIEDIYHSLMDVSIENGIFNLYFELVLSLLFFCDDGKMLRYSDTDKIEKQLALRDVIDKIDPKLNIFHNFSNSNIQKIFAEESLDTVDHMYKDLINFYK